MLYFKIIVYVSMCIVFGFCFGSEYKDTFTAAVYEHDVILPTFTLKPTSRKKALQEMMKNLEIYKTTTKEAALKGSDIIIFPEDGIYGMVWNGDRDLIYPFLEYIPEPASHWNPCLDPEKYPNSDVQIYLSCMAKENSIYLVANFGDKQPCTNKTDPNCPPDGRYQFNTDVVYDPSGNFITKYHKYSLFGENNFDTPQKPEVAIFNTPFGRFGIFTCFDILFKHPAIDLIQKYKIANIVFPTAWMDAEPFLTSVQFHSSFAAAYGVNVLAANIHFPVVRFHGSGLYTPDGAAAYYYNTSLLSGGKLIIHEIQTVKMPKILSNDTEVPVRGNQGPSFTAEIFKDEHNLVKLQGSSGETTVCHNSFCCNVSFNTQNSKFQNESIQKSHSNTEFFALGAFDGLHKDLNNYYIQVCSLLKCQQKFGETPTCGNYNKENSSHKFMATVDTFTMFGNFTTPYVYPEMLLVDGNDVKLTSYPNKWSYANGYLTVNKPLDFPLGVASILGRVYEKDMFK